jgi:uncharacterized membrane protein (UPF0127 family)
VRALAIILVLLILAGCAGESAGKSSSSAVSSGATSAPSSEPRNLTIETSGGEEVEVRVEVADSDSERARGLMDRTALGEDRGMLFVFEEEQELSFWMKDTLIPLSIAYMDSEGRIVDIQDMKALDDDPPHYASAEPARYALEVNKGFFEERGVEVGDKAELPV